MRHSLAVVLALTACAVPAGATSLPAVGESIADTPAQCAGRRPPRSAAAQAGPTRRDNGPRKLHWSRCAIDSVPARAPTVTA
ncbi:hypothetical protein ACWCOW_37250 [Streptomyces sp. NPDC001939]